MALEEWVYRIFREVKGNPCVVCEPTRDVGRAPPGLDPSLPQRLGLTPGLLVVGGRSAHLHHLHMARQMTRVRTAALES